MTTAELREKLDGIKRRLEKMDCHCVYSEYWCERCQARVAIQEVIDAQPEAADPGRAVGP